MANLESLHQWRAFAPNIGSNINLPQGEQFLLEVKVGLSFKELGEYQVALKSTPHADLGAVVAKYVRVVGGPHTIGGEPVVSFEDYWALLTKYATDGLIEVTAAVPHFNSITETQTHFSMRRSGGQVFTPPRSAAKKESPSGDR